MWRQTILMACLSCSSCQQEVVEQAHPISQHQAGDLILPALVREAAPHAQQHLYELVRYRTAHFQVKPEFVFLDMDRKHVGQLHPHVSRLNWLHLAYWKEQRLTWSGSVLLGAGRGWMGFSERGFTIKITCDSKLHLQFVDGKRKFEDHFSENVPRQRWLDSGSTRLFVFFDPPSQHHSSPRSPSAAKEPSK